MDPIRININKNGYNLKKAIDKLKVNKDKNINKMNNLNETERTNNEIEEIDLLANPTNEIKENDFFDYSIVGSYLFNIIYEGSNYEPDILENIENWLTKTLKDIGINTPKVGVIKFLAKNGIPLSVEMLKDIQIMNNGIEVVLSNGVKIFLSDGIIKSIKTTNNIKFVYKKDKSLSYIAYEEDDGELIDLTILKDIKKNKFDLKDILCAFKTDNGTKSIIFNDNTNIIISPENYISIIESIVNNYRLNFDKNGNIINGYFRVNGKYELIDIFSDYNKYTKQFGGSQMSFKYNIEELLDDPYILNKIREFFPNATDEDCELYLYKIVNTGCGYTAFVNAIFERYKGKEQEFYNKFGFSMYKMNKEGKLDFNYEYLILDIFNGLWGNSGYSIEEIYAGITKDVTDGALNINEEYDDYLDTGSGTKIYNKMCEYLNHKYGMNINMKSYDVNLNNVIDLYKELIKEGNSNIVLSCSNFDMYNLDGTLYNTSGKIGGHAMYITGITNKGDLIVSSWGEEYIVDLSSIEGYFKLRVFS